MIPFKLVYLHTDNKIIILFPCKCNNKKQNGYKNKNKKYEGWKAKDYKTYPRDKRGVL